MKDQLLKTERFINHKQIIHRTYGTDRMTKKMVLKKTKEDGAINTGLITMMNEMISEDSDGGNDPNKGPINIKEVI